MFAKFSAVSYDWKTSSPEDLTLGRGAAVVWGGGGRQGECGVGNLGACSVACVAGAEGGGEKREKGKREWSLTLSPISRPFFPVLPTPLTTVFIRLTALGAY